MHISRNGVLWLSVFIEDTELYINKVNYTWSIDKKVSNSSCWVDVGIDFYQHETVIIIIPNRFGF